MAKKIVPTLWYLRPEFLALAVLRVYRYNEKVVTISGCDADDETWTTNSVQRTDLFLRTRTEWSRIAGKDFTWFPYSEDAIVRLYLRYQLRDGPDLRKWEKELETITET